MSKDDRQEWELGQEVKLFNGSLRKLRLERGLSQAQAAKKIGISVQTLNHAEAMKKLPDLTTMEKIEKFYGVKKENLFPVEFLKMMRGAEKSKIQYAKMEIRELEASKSYAESYTRRLEASTDPAKKVDDQIRKDMLYEAMSALSEREQKILKMRFGVGGESPHTIEEVAAMYEVTRERIRQLEQKAFSKLRKNSTLRRQREFLLDIEPDPEKEKLREEMMKREERSWLYA